MPEDQRWKKYHRVIDETWDLFQEFVVDNIFWWTVQAATIPVPFESWVDPNRFSTVQYLVQTRRATATEALYWRNVTAPDKLGNQLTTGSHRWPDDVDVSPDPIARMSVYQTIYGVGTQPNLEWPSIWRQWLLGTKKLDVTRLMALEQVTLFKVLWYSCLACQDPGFHWSS